MKCWFYVFNFHEVIDYYAVNAVRHNLNKFQIILFTVKWTNQMDSFFYRSIFCKILYFRKMKYIKRTD